MHFFDVNQHELHTRASSYYFARSKAIAALKKAFEKRKLSPHYLSVLFLIDF
ncbi:hypothetical protein DI53_3628 [Sphingobacterium deserti]|uniref:Uncharacterized protein n=1 Tax=Sphingobacterium deserti TaxID=1229276 RepID=A0A0B8T1N9_9SPHI|nr:hypothetical protein DI53_3628 [Sphingobacterium deserti]